MSNYIVTGADMTSVADAIRAKGAQGVLVFPGGWVSAIGNIGGSDSWMGKNASRVYQSSVITEYFGNSAWSTWTPTTTATTLAATETYTTMSTNMNNYDYLIHFQMYEQLFYNSGAVNKALLNKACMDQWALCTRYASNRTNLVAGTRNGNNTASVLSQTVMDYYNTSGTQTVALSWGYGLYPSAPTPTFSSSTSATPTLNIRMPQFNARCSTSYLTTANAGYINQSTSYYKVKFEVWRVDAGSCMLRACQDNRMTLFNNGL